MTSAKKWLIGLAIVSVLWGSTIFFSLDTAENMPISLPWIWALIAEKVPDSWLLHRYLDVVKWGSIEQSNEVSLDFTIHPSLFSSQYNTGSYLLSGSSTIQIQTIYDTIRKVGMISWATSLHVEGIREYVNQEEPSPLENDSIEDISGTVDTSHSFDVTIYREAKIEKNDLYFLLDQIDFSTDQENWLTTIRQRYLLINQYKQKRIHFSRSDVPQMAFFLPDFLVQIVNNNNQKTRMVPDQNDGWLYLLSGQNLVISGNIAKEGNDTLSVDFPEHRTTVTFEDKDIPGMVGVHAVQNDRYQGSFNGDAQIEHSSRKHSLDMQGDLLWPGGIYGKLLYKLTQEKGRLLTNEITPPKQFLERTTIYRNRKQLRDVEKIWIKATN